MQETALAPEAWGTRGGGRVGEREGLLSRPWSAPQTKPLFVVCRSKHADVGVQRV